MRAGFYPRLAWDAIRKNRRMVFPFILTGILMVMMYYILSFLTDSTALTLMEGGTVLITLLPLGCGVIALFSLLFLFYTYSFLIKSRYREFGLYNILGMDKHNLTLLIFWEILFITVISVGAGLVCGMALSKAAELILFNLLDRSVDFTLRIGWHSLIDTMRIYGGIYFLLLVFSLIKVYRSKPLELMRSSITGEKRIQCNWIMAAAGLVLTVGAYVMALRIEEPLAAFTEFFIAVLMVIAGTFLIFISGSVALCKLLQKNKRYYYRADHFISISSMAYRMKRNGAGLASICILLTMVLVVVSSTTSLYFGQEDAIRNRYPYGINITMMYNTPEKIMDESLEPLRDTIFAQAPENTTFHEVRYGVTAGMFTDEGIILDYTHADSIDYNRLGQLYIVSVADYNRMTNKNETLGPDECLIYSQSLSVDRDTFTMEYGTPYRIKERLSDYPEIGEARAMTSVSVYLVVDDVFAFTKPVIGMKNDSDSLLMAFAWLLGFDCADADEEVVVYDRMEKTVADYAAYNEDVRSVDVSSRENERSRFYELYGGLFFLGVMLSFVFLIAAVLIIYYKQIFEGYEDQKRFEIMQKVGMTKMDIRKSINSQMRTVFFLPLGMAGLHLGFAFPFVSKILLLFAFDNTLLNAIVTIVCLIVFGLLYAGVYKITSGSYYTIVSGETKSGSQPG